MREGIDEMLQYEKKTAKTERIYTYEKAVERYYTATLVKLNERLVPQHTLNLKGQFVQRWYQSLCTTAGKCLSAPKRDARAGVDINDILHQPPAS